MEIEDAVQKAIAFARESPGPDRTSGIRLEEVESSEFDGIRVWLITLSSLPPDRPPFPRESLFAALGADTNREYKVFMVRKDDGEVLSMKIRLLSTSMG
jgi:hypothetical protein